MVDDYFGNWLCGITDGEGSFGIYKQIWFRKDGIRTELYNIRFTIHLRMDDLSVLKHIKEKVGFGNISFDKTGNPSVGENPNCFYSVNKNNDLIKLVRIFDKYKLRSKKNREFDIWKEAIYIKKTRKNAQHPYLLFAYEKLNDLKKYDHSIIDRLVNV